MIFSAGVKLERETVQAKDKKLTGAAATSFVKKCEADMAKKK